MATTRTGLSGGKVTSLVREQLLEASEALADCDSIIVHAMSNNGYGTWLTMAPSFPRLASRVRGIVFDCGVMVGCEFGEAQWLQVLSKTIVRQAAALLALLSASVCSRSPIRLGASPPPTHTHIPPPTTPPHPY